MRYREFNPTLTFPQLLARRAAEEPDEVALRQWTGGSPREVTWKDYHDRVAELALGLTANGVRPGDRVAIMSDARPEWTFAAMAAQSAGAVPLGVYPTNSQPEVGQILARSGAAAFIGEAPAHLDKVVAVAAELPELRLVVGIDAAPGHLSEETASSTLEQIRLAGAQAAEQDPERFGGLIAAGKLDDPAVLFYTSGSTGVPKGVTHSHRTLQHAAQTVWGYYPDLDRVRRDAVGFLPLAHVAPALVVIFTPLITRLVVTYCRMEEHEEVLRAVRPTAVLWPPRFYEKHAGAAITHVERWGPARRRLYDAGMWVGRRMASHRWARRRPPVALRLAYAAALRWVFLPLRALVGLDRMQVAWSASAPMPSSVMALWQIWGLDLRETYGLTETAGSVTGHYEMPFSPPGDIGRAFPEPRWEVRRADDGEMLVRAPLLFVEYWQDQAATEAAKGDGWFRTGDLVEVAPSGGIRLVGRKKDVIITSGGKTISPQPVEVSLKECRFITEAVMVGDGRKFLSVLLEVDRAALEAELGDGAGFDDAVAVRLQLEIDRVNANLARAEQLKRFRVLPRPLTVETQERTPNGKIKREGVLSSFASLIDEMYGIDETQAISGHVRAWA